MMDNDVGFPNKQKNMFLRKVSRLEENMNTYNVWIWLNAIGIVVALVSLYICYFHFDTFHYNLCSFYARIGHAEAQHVVGERLLHGMGVEKNPVSTV